MLALHHLPDLWKLIALQRISNMLKSRGKLYLKDVVFSFNPSDHENYFDRLICDFPPALASGLETHIREEYSTLDWVMEGLITRAGFTIDTADYHGGYMGHYLCTKA